MEEDFFYQILMKLSHLLLLSAAHLWTLALLGQELEVDSLYREDQIFIGFSYNLVTGRPSEITTSQFSGGFQVGFIRDMPINERRNLALGLGAGWSLDTYGQNLFIGNVEDGEATNFQVLDRDRIDFRRNRFSTQSVTFPLQLRWRTSTPETYKFWRVYAGVTPSYLYHFKSVFEQEGNLVRQTEVPELQKWRWGATFTFGYNTFNFYFYYSLNSFFDETASIEGEELDLRAFQVGLVFYLL